MQEERSKHLYYEEKAKEFLDLMPKLHGPMKSDQVNMFSHGERCLLVTLYDNGGRMLPSELAKILNVSTPRVTSILKLTEEKGLVMREEVSGDRRKVHVVLTKAGEDQVIENRKRVMEHMTSYLHMLGEEDTENLLRIMKKTDAYFQQKQ